MIPATVRSRSYWAVPCEDHKGRWKLMGSRRIGMKYEEWELAGEHASARTALRILKQIKEVDHGDGEDVPGP